MYSTVHFHVSSFVHVHFSINKRQGRQGLGRVQREYAELSRRFEEDNAKLEGLKAKKAELAFRRKKLEAFVEGFMKQPEVLDEWDEDAWRLIVDKADV